MAKKIMQFRYYGDTSENNQPRGINKYKLIGKDENHNQIPTVFKDYLPFTQLGIQTLPGVRVYLNNNEAMPIIIGPTGIYELELEGISNIEDIYFDYESLRLIEKNPNAHLIIDVICDA